MLTIWFMAAVNWLSDRSDSNAICDCDICTYVKGDKILGLIRLSFHVLSG